MFLLYKFEMMVFLSILNIEKGFTKAETINLMFQNVPVDLVTNLYEKYMEAVKDVLDTNQESMRRLFFNNNEFKIHVRRLKDVNAYKMHNLLIKEESSPKNPFIYINNPVEAKFPNAFLTLDEFRKALTNRIKNQKETLEKTNHRILRLGVDFVRAETKIEDMNRYYKPTRTNSKTGINNKYKIIRKATTMKVIQTPNKQTKVRQQVNNTLKKIKVPKSALKVKPSLREDKVIHYKSESKKATMQSDTANNTKLEKAIDSVLTNVTQPKDSTSNTTIIHTEDTYASQKLEESTIDVANTRTSTEQAEYTTDNTKDTTVELVTETEDTTTHTYSYVNLDDTVQTYFTAKRTVTVPTRRTWHTLGKPAVFMGG